MDSWSFAILALSAFMLGWHIASYGIGAKWRLWKILGVYFLGYYGTAAIGLGVARLAAWAFLGV